MKKLNFYQRGTHQKMITIEANAVGKRFRYDWIFRNLTHTFRSGERTALLGPNGSGKSTLMKVLSGHVSPSRGSMILKENEQVVPNENWFRKVSYAAPYIDLVEEMTLAEAITFHGKLKSFYAHLHPDDVLDVLELTHARHKQIRFFSSGMKQRLKIGLAACSDSPILLLDEPTTNLDEAAIEWYKNVVQRFSSPERLVVIASNDPIDVAFCTQFLQILDFKSASARPISSM